MRTSLTKVSLCVAFTALCVWGQYQPYRHSANVVLPGEQFIELVAPEYSVENLSLTDAFKDLVKRYGLRLSIEIFVSGKFSEPKINIKLRQAPIKEILNAIVRSSGFSPAVWTIGTNDVNSYFVTLGRRPDNSALSMTIPKWVAPNDNYPGEVISNIFWYVPELREQFYPYGVVGDKAPYASYGCRLAYSAERTSVEEIIHGIARLSKTSWLMVYVTDDEKKSRILVF